MSWKPGVREAQRTEDPFGQQIGEGPVGNRLHDADQQLEAGVGVAGLLPGSREVLRLEVRALLLARDPHRVLEAPGQILTGDEMLMQAAALGSVMLERIP